MSQLSFANLTPKKKSLLRSEKFLQEMNDIIPWRRIYNLIKHHYYDNKTGRQAYDLNLMMKVYCLQQWYNLGDLAMEEAIYDRRSFQNFLRIDLMFDAVPDETTILNFRHLLEKNDLQQKIFQLLNSYLTSRGLIMKSGTIVDATIINSPSSTKNQEKKRDPEMSSTRKNNTFHFGMKAHIGVDSRSGLIHSCEITTANTADNSMWSDLLHGEEKAVFGDKGYVSKIDKYYARDAGIFWGVLDRGSKNRSLSNKQKKRNHKLSKIRSKVEHPFRVVKSLWGHCKTRYRGLTKNRHQFYMLFGLSNIYMARKHLLQES